MKTSVKHALAFLLVCMSAQVSANEIWVPGTAAGAKLEYVTLNTNRYAIDTVNGWWVDKTRIEFGFESDTTTYFVLPEQFERNPDRAMEEYRTLRDAFFNKVPVNIQVDADTRDFLQIRLGATDHPLVIWRRSGNGVPGAEDPARQIDLLGRNWKSASGLSWLRLAPARR